MPARHQATEWPPRTGLENLVPRAGDVLTHAE